MENLKCFECNLFVSTYDDDLYPYSTTDYPKKIICCRCLSYKNPPYTLIDEEIRKSIEYEILKATCDCVTANSGNPKAGYSLDTKSLIVYCKQCPFNNYSNLRTSNPRAVLKGIFNMIKTLPDLPNELIREYLKMGNSSVEEVYLKLRKIYSYLGEQSYCLKHFKATYIFNKDSFEFVCDLCDDDRNNRVDLFDPSSYNEVLQLGVHYCQIAKTSKFTSSIITFFNSQQRVYKQFQNLLYDTKELKKNPNAKLNTSSLCLRCSRRFSIDRLPVLLHGNEHHEVCTECVHKSGKSCPIDGFQREDEMNIVVPEFIYKLENLQTKCFNCQKRFSKFKSVQPYNILCGHYYICDTCHLDNSIKNCKDCIMEIEASGNTFDYDIIRKIEFQEVICPTDSEVGIVQQITENICEECFSSNFDEISYTEPYDLCLDEQCKRRNNICIEHDLCKAHDKPFQYILKRFTVRCNLCLSKEKPINMSNCLKTLKKLIQEKFQYQHPYSDFINKHIDFLPLNYLIQTLKMKDIEARTLLRFDKVIPKNTKDSFSFWYDKGSAYCFIIDSNIRFMLKGIYVGNPDRGKGNYDVWNGYTKLEIIMADTQDPRISLIMFNSIEISKQEMFTVNLGKGRYFQGFINRKVDLQQRMKFESKYFIDMKFGLSNESYGDMNYGGPILGLSIEGVFIDPQASIIKINS